MKCMLLAAGLGERLRPITDKIPKPLLEIAGKPLIDYHLENLKSAGFNEIVINISYLGEMIESHLGDGSRFNVTIHYSHEGESPLETAGGIIQALPMLNADIWCNHSLSFASLDKDKLAHIVLVNNPAHHPKGDFAYEYGKIYNLGKNYLTYSGIGIYDPKLFKNFAAEKLPLAPILRDAIDEELISAEYYSGEWFDIGTEERLAEADNYVSKIS